jgi:hypothetical protein
VVLLFIITVLADDVADAGIINICNELAVAHNSAHLGIQEDDYTVLAILKNPRNVHI